MQPNAWGLYDMHGSVYEWTWDWDGDYPSKVTNPTGPSSGWGRAVRGGSSDSDAEECRTAIRSHSPPHVRAFFIGFRPVRSVD